MPLSSSQDILLTLYCHSGNDQVLSIDPNSLAIITLLHWLEVSFEIVSCCSKGESPSKELPVLIINDKVHSGYRSILKGLKEAGFIKNERNESSDISTLANREFLLQMNQDLLIEEFNNEEIFKNFTEPALLNAKSRYFWNFVKSRIFPLNHQISSFDCSKLTQISKKSQRIDECIKIINDPSIENKILLFSNLIIRSLLPKQHQFQLPEFSKFIHELSIELDLKEFKGKSVNKATSNNFKPVYRHENNEEYQESKMSCSGISAYTGLFGVIFAVAVLYSIKNR